LCRNIPPAPFREVEAVQQAEGQPPEVMITVHSHYPFVALNDVGCDKWRPPLGLLASRLRALWWLVVSL
jgi:hypothetical protein